MTLEGVLQRCRRAWLALRGLPLDRSVKLRRNVSIQPGAWRIAREAIRVGAGCELEQGVELNAWGGHIRIGERVFLGPHVVVYGHGGVQIGDQTLVSMHCSILSSNHGVPGRSQLIRSQPDVLLPTRIGKDVWLGAGVTVLGGVTIGDGCVVGAGAVVSGDLPPYSIAVGVPARVVRMRE